MPPAKGKQGTRRPGGIRAAVAFGLALATLADGLQAATTAGAPPAPRRIVSTNLCADSLVLELVARERILSVSNQAADPLLSNVADRARDIPANAGRAEEIIRFAPDLVVSGLHVGRETTALLRRLGFTVLLVPPANSLEEVRGLIRSLSRDLGVPARGRRMVESLDARLAAVAASVGDRELRALVYGPNGYTVGRRSVSHEILAHAGLHNLATELGIDSHGFVPLEVLLHDLPDVLILDDYEERKNSHAQRLLLHPAIVRSGRDVRFVSIPLRLWLCPGPWLATAAAELAAATRSLRRRPQNAASRPFDAR